MCIRDRMRGSWANHYRRMLPSLLSVLEFRSNNAVWRPVLAALDWIRSKVDGGCRFVPLQDVPIDEVIPARWRSSVIDDDGRVNRISYEPVSYTHLDVYKRQGQSKAAPPPLG